MMAFWENPLTGLSFLNRCARGGIRQIETQIVLQVEASVSVFVMLHERAHKLGTSGAPPWTAR